MADKRSEWTMAETSVYDESESDLTPSPKVFRSQRETALVACNNLLMLLGERPLVLTPSGEIRESD